MDEHYGDWVEFCHVLGAEEHDFVAFQVVIFRNTGETDVIE
jgi:hypothetical protein